MDLRALDQDALFTTYQSILHGKKVLLFLDNARSAEQIVPLLPPKNCAMLVTSRRTFSVPGLNVCRVDVMSEEDAMDFLLELCPRIGSRAADLTKACAYLPLALRIAGSFLQVNGDWSIEEYLSRLGDRKRRLITLQVSHKEAELTTEPDLLASFDVSYNQLSGEYRKCWRILGVFPASFDVSAASAVWKFEEAETKKLLSLLLRYSLLDYDPTSSRYSLHDLLADYTLSQMDSEENGEARLRHASHYKDVLNTAKALYKQGGENIMVGLRLFDLEWHNIRAGQAWAASEAETSRAAAELCFEYPYSGAYVLQLRQHPREQMQWLEIAVSAAHQVGNRPGEMKALGNLGVAYVSLGELSKAIVFFEQVLSIAREIGDRVGEVSALGNLGTVYAGLENVTKAIEFFEQVLVITRELGDRHGEAMTLGNLGSAYGDLGNARKAIEFYEQALLIDRETGDRDGEAENLGNLGIVYSRLGEVHKAIENYESQLVIVREIGDRGGEGNALLNMGQALYELDEKDQAVHLVKQALDFFEAIESPSIEEAREKLKEWGALREDDTD
jgi:tetratricopeptide (TPR) repeat protein